MSFLTFLSLVILGCDYCNRFVEAIKTHQRHTDLEKVSFVPVVRQPLKWAMRKDIPLPAAQEPPPSSGKFIKLCVVASVTIPLQSRVMRKVTSFQHCLPAIQPVHSLNKKHQLTIANAVI